MALSSRTWSSLTLGAFLLLGTVASFFPFFEASREMHAFCEQLPAGSTAAQVRTRALAEGYVVSYEAAFRPPASDAGQPDGGHTDAGEGDSDAGPADAQATGARDTAADAGWAERQRVIGRAMLGDPQYTRMACDLVFDDSGQLKSSRFNGD